MWLKKMAGEIARNMLKSGFSVEQTAVLPGLDVVKIQTLSDLPGKGDSD